MIPKQVTDAINANKPARKLKDLAVSVGDIRTIQDFDGGANRLVLVLDIDHFLDVALVTLIHPYTEYATEHDVVVDGQTASLAFDVVIQRDLRSSVWKKQLGELVGQLSKTATSELIKPKLNLDTVSPSSYFGSNLTGPLDVRWNFKVAEGQELKNIAQDCTIAFVENKFNLQLDDLDVMTAILRAEPDYREMLVCFLDLMQVHGENLRISQDTWVKLDDLGLLDNRNWKQYGFDIAKLSSVMAELHFRSISTSQKPDGSGLDAKSASTSVVHVTLEKIREKSLVGAER